MDMEWLADDHSLGTVCLAESYRREVVCDRRR
jgi:hypothetical protein